MLKITLTSIHVDDQASAHAFYTDVLGFETRHDVAMGEDRWLTVGSPAAADGPELLLEPNGHPAAAAYMAALYDDGIPAAQFEVEDLDEAYQRLSAAGVRFTTTPTDAGPVRLAVLDDTCGNLVQLVSPVG